MPREHDKAHFDIGGTYYSGYKSLLSVMSFKKWVHISQICPGWISVKLVRRESEHLVRQGVPNCCLPDTRMHLAYVRVEINGGRRCRPNRGIPRYRTQHYPKLCVANSYQVLEEILRRRTVHTDSNNKKG